MYKTIAAVVGYKYTQNRFLWSTLQCAVVLEFVAAEDQVKIFG